MSLRAREFKDGSSLLVRPWGVDGVDLGGVNLNPEPRSSRTLLGGAMKIV